MKETDIVILITIAVVVIGVITSWYVIMQHKINLKYQPAIFMHELNKDILNLKPNKINDTPECVSVYVLGYKRALLDAAELIFKTIDKWDKDHDYLL